MRLFLEKYPYLLNVLKEKLFALVHVFLIYCRKVLRCEQTVTLHKQKVGFLFFPSTKHFSYSMFVSRFIPTYSITVHDKLY